MFGMSVSKCCAWLLLMTIINLVHHNTVIECQSTSRRNQSLGVNKNSNKVKEKEEKSISKVKKDIESETQRAIEEIDTELTTLAIDHKLSQNQTNNESSVQSDISLTSTQTSIINGTDITTPLFNYNASFNVASNETTNETFVTTTDETLDYMNTTEYELSKNWTQLNHNLTDETNHTIPPNFAHITNQTQPFTEMTVSETPTEVSEPLNESPVRSSTTSPTETFTDNNSDISLADELIQCVFDNPIECKKFQLKCFGSGEVDCGHRTKRYAQNVTTDDTDIEVFKLSLEKQSNSEIIENSQCILTPFESTHFACVPLPVAFQCSGRSFCRLIDESEDVSEGIPFWKVALIATLTAVGAICFIIVGIIAYVSYGKLKVSPDSSMNTSNRSQDVTRV